ncbi:p21-activated protein kinase-interacting protein 1-like [Musca domestica]|uniref:P21-activated protein kinase-interacting protein 1-like n=1 Tax=Musca domestica TaxID=7370 RepID=A0A9J7CZK1_MUSDO|nr:p21-activated protein kinase-interacting protein 1-like [Musca domestica]
MSVNMEIIIGTYEEFLLGYKIDIKDNKPAIIQTFADKSHSGSIRCVAVKDQWVASGATDDRIFIYDMSTRKQAQILLSHDGTVNSLAFTPDGTHLLSAADDGRMVATRLKTWFNDATWKKAHSGSNVTHVSCHPSGKLALSLGSDLVLRTWNLVKGRVAYKTNLKSRNTLGFQPDCLTWSPNGDYFTLTGQRVVEFWSIKTADVVRSQKTKSKPICLVWIADDVCLVGLEDGKILWLTVDSEDEKEIVAHNSRVKAMHSFKDNLVTASSSGEIKVWQIIKNKQKLKEIASTNIGCRPTCLGVLDLEQFGTNYIISSTIEEAKDVKPIKPKAMPVPRGIVTIEYDNEDDSKLDSDGEEDEDEDDNEDEDDDDTENDADSVAEEDSDDAEEENDKGVEENETSEESSDDCDEEEENPEPSVRLPKSRKHKMQILKSQEKGNKKQKLDNSKKQQPKPKFPQQKSNKQKLKK